MVRLFIFGEVISKNTFPNIYLQLDIFSVELV